VGKLGRTGLKQKKHGPDRKDSYRYKGIFVIFKTAGAYLQKGKGKSLLTVMVNFDRWCGLILVVCCGSDG
jgi:hypothetical protein